MFASLGPGVAGKTATFMDIGENKLYWAVGVLDSVLEEEHVEGQSTDPVSQIKRHFGDVDEVMTCLELTPTDSIFESRVFDREPLNVEDASWGGPMTLTGDAAHAVIPSIGMGACLAIEDALELGQRLSCSEAQLTKV